MKIIWVFLVLMVFRSSAQEQAILVWNFDPLAPGLSVDQCKFYVGEFVFYYNDKEVGKSSDYYLIEMGERESVSIPLITDTGFDSFAFKLGVDSLIHEKGIMYGDLDPIHDMYWTWQAGYIYAKVEGNYQGMPIRLHLGGWQSPFRCDQLIEVSCKKVQREYHFSSFFHNDWINQLRKYQEAGPWQIMSPQAPAVEWMQWMAKELSRS